MTVRLRDNGKFQAIVRVKQGGVQVHTESRMFDTERLARDWKLRVTREIKARGPVERQLSTTTMEDLIEDYRKAREAARPMGRSMHGDLDLLISALGKRPLHSLSPGLWSDFARKRHAEGAGPATVKHNLSIARALLNAAKPMFGINVDGSSVVAALKALETAGFVSNSQQRERRPSQAELDRLVAEFLRVQNHPSTVIPMHKIVPLAVALPRRMGELCAMRWLDYNGGVMTLRDTKHPRRPRTEHVPVPPAARAMLDAIPRIDERVLPYVADSVGASFERACDRVGIKDLRFHDLRHEGICRLFETGLSIPEVAMISGHTSWSTLKRYTHLRPQDVLEKMNERA